MIEDKEDMNGLGEPDKIVDMGDLNGDPIDTTDGKPVDKKDIPDFDLTDEEEELLKKKLEKLRKQDPFIYR
mgnify:CR=1 FL=1|tara:strand:- start:166 stop:378 length:213 start_codon:yes stop_codon:yes gene_type:complete